MPPLQRCLHRGRPVRRDIVVVMGVTAAVDELLGRAVVGDPPLSEGDDAVDQRRLGETVRLLRQRAGFSIQDVAKRTIRLAEKLGVSVVVDFSGCPGDSPTAKYPNWVTCPWPPEYLDVLAWQWDKVVTPYWTKHAKFAEDHGVKIAIEMHPGFVAYSPETMLKLRKIAGKNIGCNYDPSHMFWQGIDPIAVVEEVGSCIRTCHVKDAHLDRRRIAVLPVERDIARHLRPDRGSARRQRAFHVGSSG